MGSQRCVYNQPTTLEERKRIARDFVRDHDFKLPLVVDAIDNNFSKAFAAWPERFWVIRDGRIEFMAEPGPFGFHLELLRNVL